MADLITHFAISFAIGSVLNLSSNDMAYFVGANLVDLDHLLADPIYDPNRSSFVHPLHQNWLPVCLAGGVINIWLGLGMVLHFYIDYLDAVELQRLNERLI